MRNRTKPRKAEWVGEGNKLMRQIKKLANKLKKETTIIVPKDKPYLADVAKTFCNIENILFTKKKIKIGKEVLQVPRCLFCGKGMKLKKPKTGYFWNCDCKDYPKNVELYIG